jgi:hypothetical protein
MAEGTLANKRSKSKAIAVRFRPATFRRLNAIAEEREMSFAHMVRLAVAFWEKAGAP